MYDNQTILQMMQCILKQREDQKMEKYFELTHLT